MKIQLHFESFHQTHDIRFINNLLYKKLKYPKFYLFIAGKQRVFKTIFQIPLMKTNQISTTE